MAEPATALSADLCVVGGGSAGLSVAAGAAQLGLKTVLIERGVMGGDCLNFGCVPSKALLAAGAAAVAWKKAARFGLEAAPPRVDFAAVMAQLRDVIETIAPIDSQERFEGLGVTVLSESARFAAPDRIEAGRYAITARRFVIATGSRPLVPPIPGLAEAPYLTNETVFQLTERPEHLIVLGGGPIGCELAQAFARLGSRVTLVERAILLPREEREEADLVARQLAADGVDLRPGTEARAVLREGEGLRLRIATGGGEEEVAGSHLLVAVGRRPDYEGLGLEAAGIATEKGRLVLDRGLRTTNRRVYAAGDAAGGAQFTHLAGAHAGLLIKRIAFRLPAAADRLVVPRVTFTDPELAQVGLTEAEARATGREVTVLRWSFADNDRAQTERETEGFIKVLAGPGGRVLGASIVGAGAGELIAPWVLALERRLKLSALATMLAPYPTRGEVSKRAAGSYYAPKLFSKRTRLLVSLLKRLG